MNEIQQIIYSILKDLDRQDMYDEVWERIHTLPLPTTRKQIEDDVRWALASKWWQP